ncbi:single-stranded DNA-binding protein [Nocardioides sp. CPCC 206347]|uniref:single-stranded DNA-binding protein n=1 Tax=Nocardioides sp. CPCC 206347 TaxID=3406463 RepID=UPI003B42A382
MLTDGGGRDEGPDDGAEGRDPRACAAGELRPRPWWCSRCSRRRWASPHNVKVYGSAATHVHDTCGSGDPVFVHGLERTESWPAKETGEKRTKNVVVVDNRFGEVGISLRYVSARIERAERAAAQAG